MSEDVKETVRKILDNYLEMYKHRKTPERYAILDAVYMMKGHFSLEELGLRLEKQHFLVSRATLYNTMKLFLELRLITCHRFCDGTKYEASYNNKNHAHQICTVCGKVIEIESPDIVQAIDNIKLKRFRKDGFSLYIYGICSSCQAKITRHKRMEIKEKNQNNNKHEYRKS